MTTMKAMGLSMLALGALLLCSLPLAAADDSQPQNTLQHATDFGAGHVTVVLPRPYGLHLATPVRLTPKQPAKAGVDPVVQHNKPYPAEFALNYHVLGVGNGFPGYSVPDAPPDTTLAVGDTEVVQWVNTEFADFNKSTGAVIKVNGNDFNEGNLPWQVLTGSPLCKTSNDGDIIVKFDRAAHRWIMAQNVVFTSPYAVCVAISQTATFSDNLWYAYQFPVVANGFPDYQKWGIWSSGGPSDGYYQTWNNFGPGGSGFVGPVFCGYDRAKMLAGDPTAEQICHQYTISPNYQDSLLPADRESPIPPPASEDEFAIGSLGDDAVNPNTKLGLYSVHINNWSTGSASFTGDNLSQELTIPIFTPACNGAYDGNCVPEPGVSMGDYLETLGGRLLYRLVYWEDQPPANATATPPKPAPVQHWLVSHVVTGSSMQNAERWYDIIANLKTVPVTSLTVFQSGTYEGSPADSQWRWFGAISRDKKDDILLGYSESSTTLHPSIAVAGRTVTDPLGTLSAEVFSVMGTGSQTDTGNRWGDYSTMAIDPTDNCTFFYTTEYYMVTNTFDWSTDISSWKFPNCN